MYRFFCLVSRPNAGTFIALKGTVYTLESGQNIYNKVCILSYVIKVLLSYIRDISRRASTILVALISVQVL
jgi:hypothetical protein